MPVVSPSAKQPSSTKGRRRRAAILDAAEAILIDEGYAGFSMRKLADKLGMRLSNVQYYFPTPNTVIDALFTGALDSAREALETRVTGNLQSLVHYALAGQNSALSCRLFWEVWALSARDADVAHTLQRFYTAYRDAIEQHIKAIEPSLPAAARRRRAILIMSLLEGLSLFRGHGRKLAGAGRALDRDIQDAAHMLAGTWPEQN